MRWFLVLYMSACGPLVVRSLAASFQWPGDLNGIPAANSVDTSVIESIINASLAPEAITARVREFRFVPLEEVDRVDLIASIDTSRRGIFNAYIAIWPNAAGYGYSLLPSDAQTVLARDVVDLDGRGVYSVITGGFPGGYQGADTIPIPWYAVYTLKRGKWLDVSDRHQRLYEGDLGRRSALLLRLAEGCSAGEKELVQLYKVSALFVRFRYERAVLHKPSAGLEVALEWADASAPLIQLLAVESLRDITGARAVSRLKRLTESSDIRVRIAAKDALAHLQSGLGQRRQ